MTKMSQVCALHIKFRNLIYLFIFLISCEKIPLLEDVFLFSVFVFF